MKNYEIYNCNEALSELIDEKITGAFKFRVFAVKSELENKLTVLMKALEGVEDKEEETEILDQEQEVTIKKFTPEELEVLPLSMKQIGLLKPIINFEEKGE